MNLLKFLKSKVATFLVVIATFILSGIAIFTAVKLYQSRQGPVAPNVPESEPQAQVVAPSITEAPTPTESYPEQESERYLAFTINESLAATPTPTIDLIAQVTPTTTLTPTPTAVVTATPTATLTPTATTTPTQLLDAGVGLPTIVVMSFGLLLIMGALLLAI